MLSTPDRARTYNLRFRRPMRVSAWQSHPCRAIRCTCERLYPDFAICASADAMCADMGKTHGREVMEGIQGMLWGANSLIASSTVRKCISGISSLRAEQSSRHDRVPRCPSTISTFAPVIADAIPASSLAL